MPTPETTAEKRVGDAISSFMKAVNEAKHDSEGKNFRKLVEVVGIQRAMLGLTTFVLSEITAARADVLEEAAKALEKRAAEYASSVSENELAAKWWSHKALTFRQAVNIVRQLKEK
jgi:hypothetical protein